MRDLDIRSHEKNILLDIRNFRDDSFSKYEASVNALSKAMGFDSERAQKEVSPFRAVRDLEKLSKDTVEERLLKLYNTIIGTWVDVQKASKETFILNGRIFIDPKTGNPLTKAQWRIIKKDILRAFKYIYASEQERIVLHAMSLGKVIKGLPLKEVTSVPYVSLEDRINQTMRQIKSPQWEKTVSFAEQNVAENIVELNQKQYRKIHNTIQTSIMNRDNSRQLKSKLFENFGEMNRDWRMIAETEIANSQNNGQLLTVLERAAEGENSFVKGISSSESCPFCLNEINGKIFALLPQSPSGGDDQVTLDGKVYTAIWPGKSNVGRRRNDWWAASGTQHPHCRCTWVEHVPGFEKFDEMYRQAMAESAEGYTGKRYIPPVPKG